MGYFSNGTEGMIYEERYCERCIHYGDEEEGCPIWMAHLLYNYDEANNDASVLNILIPINKENGENEQCTMFIEEK